MRGLCVLYSGKDYALTAFLARARWDADIDEAGVASVKRSGEHRSTAQIQRKGALSEKTAGARIAIAVPGGAIGLAGLRSTYSAPLPAFGGPSARRACVSADWRVGGPWGTVFGEYARALAGPAAGLVGTRLAAGRLRLALLIRNYQRGFNSMRGRAFSAYSGPPGNERGLYVGGAWRPVAGTLVEAGLDRHGRIEPAGNTPVPERGNRLSLKTTRRVGRSSEIRVDFRHDAETVAVRDHTGLRVRRRLRIRIRMARGPLTVRPWASAGRSSSPGGGGPARAVGLLAGLGASGGTRLDGWIALFRVSHYDARIYTATPDVWGGSRLSVLSGTGAIAGARLTVRLGSLQVSGRLDWKNTEARRTTSWAIQVGLDRNR